jgi:PTH1 family peptidyl-tRNA hydrolase
MDLVLAVPTTLMNLSGRAVVDMLAELNLKPAQILVVVDDFNLPLGALRFRARGSDGGHNGLASIIERLETEDFPRLRLGISLPADNQDVTSFVLSRFGEKELDAVERMVANAAKAVIFAVTHGLEEAMVQFNSSPASPEES